MIPLDISRLSRRDDVRFTLRLFNRSLVRACVYVCEGGREVCGERERGGGGREKGGEQRTQNSEYGGTNLLSFISKHRS